MKLKGMTGLIVVLCGILIPSYTWSESGRPAAQVDKSDPAVLQWRFYSDLSDGRRFLTDGSLLLESRYVSNSPIPEKSIPPHAAERLLKSITDHEFSLADLDRKGEHYMAPGSIQLNRKYIDYLRGSPLKASLRFSAKGPNDPVLILDDKKVVGVVMPMKSLS